MEEVGAAILAILCGCLVACFVVIMVVVGLGVGALSSTFMRLRAFAVCMFTDYSEIPLDGVEPARKHWILHGVWQSLSKWMDITTSEAEKEAKAAWEQCKSLWHCIFIGISGGIYAAALLACLILAGLTCVLIALLIAPWLAAMLVLWLIDWGHRWWWKLTYHCPICHSNFSLPCFLCPQCDRRHYALTSNRLGLLWHRCVCGHHIASSDWSGRHQLDANCRLSHCDEPLSGKATTPHVFALAGGVSQGKTSVLVRILRGLKTASSHKGVIITPHPRDEKRLQDLLAHQEAKFVAKTPAGAVAGLRLLMQSPLRKADRLICFYDAAGENYVADEEAKRQLYLRHLSAVLFIVDPFAMDAYAQALDGHLNTARDWVCPGAVSPADCFASLINALAAVGCIPEKGRCEAQLVFVITKTDALGTAKLIDSMPGQSAEDRAWKFLESYGWPKVLAEINKWFSKPPMIFSSRHQENTQTDAAIAEWLINSVVSG